MADVDPKDNIGDLFEPWQGDVFTEGQADAVEPGFDTGVLIGQKAERLNFLTKSGQGIRCSGSRKARAPDPPADRCAATHAG